MEDFIKDQLSKASSIKRKSKDFVGLNGEKNPNNMLKKMVDKIVRE